MKSASRTRAIHSPESETTIYMLPLTRGTMNAEEEEKKRDRNNSNVGGAERRSQWHQEALFSDSNNSEKLTETGADVASTSLASLRPSVRTPTSVQKRHAPALKCCSLFAVCFAASKRRRDSRRPPASAVCATVHGINENNLLSNEPPISRSRKVRKNQKPRRSICFVLPVLQPKPSLSKHSPSVSPRSTSICLAPRTARRAQ